MATLLHHAAALLKAYPDGGPVYLDPAARIFWPGADWLRATVNNHNGGAKRGARCAGALLGRMEKAGFVTMRASNPRNYRLRIENIKNAMLKSAQGGAV